MPGKRARRRTTLARIFEDEAVLPSDHSIVCIRGRRLLSSCLGRLDRCRGNRGRGETWRRHGRNRERRWCHWSGQIGRWTGRSGDGLRRDCRAGRHGPGRGVSHSLRRDRRSGRHSPWGGVGGGRVACRRRIAAGARREAGQQSRVIGTLVSRDHVLGKLSPIGCSGEFAFRGGEGA
jgi:hypothetical protein